MSGELFDELDEAAIAAGHDCYCGRSPDTCEDTGGCPASREIARLKAALDGLEPLLGAYRRLYDAWWNEGTTVEISVPGYNGISYDDTLALDDAAEKIEALLKGAGHGSEEER